MRDRAKTIAALRALAERPGTPAEGETARKKLRELEALHPAPSSHWGQSVREIPLDDPFIAAMRKRHAEKEQVRIRREAMAAVMRDATAMFENDFASFKVPTPGRVKPVPPKVSRPAPSTCEDMESMIRRAIFRNTPDED